MSTKTCLLVVDTPTAVWTHDIGAPAAATIDELLVIASGLCPYPGVAWAAAAVGVYGARCERSCVPADGARVEVYRELHADPRELRRQRASRSAVSEAAVNEAAASESARARSPAAR